MSDYFPCESDHRFLISQRHIVWVSPIGQNIAYVSAPSMSVLLDDFTIDAFEGPDTKLLNSDLSSLELSLISALVAEPYLAFPQLSFAHFAC